MLVVGVKRGDFLLIKRLRISIAQPAHKGYSENVKECIVMCVDSE